MLKINLAMYITMQGKQMVGNYKLQGNIIMGINYIFLHFFAFIKTTFLSGAYWIMKFLLPKHAHLYDVQTSHICLYML